MTRDSLSGVERRHPRAVALQTVGRSAAWDVMSASPIDAVATRSWLQELHGKSSGLVHMSAAGLWKGASFLDLDEATAWAVSHGDADGVYVRCTTLRRGFSAGGRGKATDSCELPGLWADLDLAGPGHRPPPAGLQLLPDLGAAKEVISILPPPTLWVHSGGGLYPWWLLCSPHVIDVDLQQIQQLSHSWHAHIADTARTRGFHVPGTGDLARVLRVPGTYNRKEGQQRPCRVMEHSGPRYTLEDLRAALPEPVASGGPAKARARNSKGGKVGPAAASPSTLRQWPSGWPAWPPEMCEPEGRRYELFGPDGQAVPTPPAPSDLPRLPEAWKEALSPGGLSAAAAGGPAASRETSRAPARQGQARPPQPLKAPATSATAPARSSPAVCNLSLDRSDEVRKALAGDGRHDAVRQALLRLLRARADGHHGVEQLLDELRTDYVSALGQARGAWQAGAEFDRMVAGTRVPRPRPRDSYAVCACELQTWETWLARPDAFTGRGARLQRRIMQSLVREAKRTGSARVKKSTRQIAEDAESTPRTVAKHLRALGEQGRWSQVLNTGRQTTHVVLAPAPETATTAVPAYAAGPSVVAGTCAPAHPIFGSQGLRGNQELTFNVLDLYCRPIARGYLVAVRARHGAMIAGSRPRGWRRVSRPSGRGGLTAKRISALNGLPVQTVRSHLGQMKAKGLVRKIDSLWYRVAFDADEVAREWGVQDVPALRKGRHLRERQQYWDGRAALPPGDAFRVLKQEQSGSVLYVDCSTGVVLWSFGGDA